MPQKGIILFGHGARDPEWAGPMLRLQCAVQALDGQLRVELAFLEFMQPSLEVAVAGLVEAGCGDITVVPVFLAQGGHLKREIPLLIEGVRQRFPAAAIRMRQAVGESERVISAIAASVFDIETE